jgi:hypothetical protein
VASRPSDPAEVRDAVAAVAKWLRDDAAAVPERGVLARAVRLTARAMAAAAPGSSVEVRIPPFVAVQCMSGPRHSRGTPPNVVETDARTWLMLSTGRLDLDAAVAAGSVQMSGARAADVGRHLPLAGC